MLIELLVLGIVSSVVAFFTVYLTTPILIKFLASKNSTVKDCFKPGDVMIPRPGGPSILAGILAAESVLYAFLQLDAIIAVMITSSLAFIVGLVDDRKVMGGWFKPLALAACAVPIIFIGAYDTSIVFPIFGDVSIPILYLGVIVIMISITGNTINSIDVLNGVASGFMTIASISLTISLLILENYEIAVVSLPMIFVSLAFYKFHKIPCKIFPGDSGALTWGAMYGAMAIVGGIEIIAAIALLPAIVNSFLFLSSTKKIVEHREIKARPTYITDDFKIKATSKKATVTLMRLITANKALTEKEICIIIFKLAIFSGVLAITSAFLTRISL